MAGVPAESLIPLERRCRRTAGSHGQGGGQSVFHGFVSHRMQGDHRRGAGNRQGQVVGGGRASFAHGDGHDKHARRGRRAGDHAGGGIQREAVPAARRTHK